MKAKSLIFVIVLMPLFLFPSYSIGQEKIFTFERGLEVHLVPDFVYEDKYKMIVKFKNPTDDIVSADCIVELKDSHGKVLFRDAVFFKDILGHSGHRAMFKVDVDKMLKIDTVQCYLSNVEFKENKVKAEFNKNKEETMPKEIEIIGKAAKLRPRVDDFSRFLAEIPVGTRLKVLDQQLWRGGGTLVLEVIWYKVKYKGKIGWISEYTCKKVK